MKLSRKQLEDFIVGSMRDNGENGWGSEEERAALEALRNDSLEIEGYTRDKWTRFDPKDPKTFPPIDTTVLLTVQGRYDVICTWRTCANERQIAFGLPRPFTHWRPLPPPPGKEEQQ
jgi:hypothetical protein